MRLCSLALGRSQPGRPKAGDPDDARAAKAACLAAEPAGLPVLARSLPGARGGWVIELGTDAAAARAIQRCAAGAHASWLIPPAPDSTAGQGLAAVASQAG